MIEAPDFRWRQAVITAIAPVTARVKSFRMRTEIADAYRPGQHVDVRLTAEDGYRAQRSYSIASAPDGSATIELMIEGLEGGEVSGFFHEIAEVGDAIELRGPIGGAFSWGPADGGPLLLVGGGSGVVPLLAMLRHRGAVAPEIPALLLYSARTRGDAIALDEIEARAGTEPGLSLIFTATRSGGRRIDAATVAEALTTLGHPTRVFICGATPFVGTAATLLVEAGVAPGLIRTERFGG
ncbi:FAD-binding oxidoreductase [Methylobacterium sp. WL103]|uniref:FAD-binding oxidoreductase n=1 Tax=Methylobacterium sp. WL103 TaxID=2603891 RepID=UPI001FEE9FF6|nr:FAD-binding oxidoreductase [Methylobacterium sp. WL103]